MRRLFTFISIAVLAVMTSSCYDDSKIFGELSNLGDQILSMNDRLTKVENELAVLQGDVNALAEAEVSQIEEIVRPCGLGNSKARDISACMKQLRDVYGGVVPDDFDKLLALPGVGRKSANLIMGDVFGKPAIVTDTHCIRLVNRMGLVDGIKEPSKVEKALWKIIPPEEGNDLCHRLVDHGRAICTARTKPYCDRCCLKDVCKQVGVNTHK
jgi:endonuclease-3